MRRKSFCKWFFGTSLVLALILTSLYLVLRTEKRDLDQAAREGASGDFIELPAGIVHYHLAGHEDKPLVVLVHGFSVPDYVWEPTFKGLVEAGYRVLSYDLFGRGYSDRPDLVYDLVLFNNQLEDLLIGLEIDEPVHLVGLSMGGPIAARYAYQHTEKVKSLILISPVVVQPANSDIFPLNLPGVGEYLMATIMEPIILPKLQVEDFYQPDNFQDWEDLYRVQLQYRGTGKALLSTIRQLVIHDPGDEYRELEGTDLPVLLVWGVNDQTIGLDQIEILKAILPEMEILQVERAGHLVHYERPEKVNSEIMEFLDRIGY